MQNYTRLKKLQQILLGKNIDFAFFHNLCSGINPNMVYFTDYKGLGILIVPKKKSPFLIVPEMEYEKAKRIFEDTISSHKKKMFDAIKKKLKKSRIKNKKIAIDFNLVNLNFKKILNRSFNGFRAVDISSFCQKLRQIKDSNEIKNIKKACNISDKIFLKLTGNFNDFSSEKDIKEFIEKEIKKFQCEESFPAIVASGKNSSMPHYETKNIKLSKGFCVIDFGVKYNGYCSDITRTIFIGKPKPIDTWHYNFLLNIQKNTINGIIVEDKCSEIYEKSVASFGKFKKFFIHGLGHGVGIEIHELPNLTLNSKDILQENMVFTIEPGIYMPKKFGIRIEDTLIMKERAICLTKSAKDMIIMEHV